MENAKTILAIIGLLAIGFLGGFFAHRQMIKKEVHKVARLGEGPVMMGRILHLVNPTEEQKAQLEPILKNHSQKMASLMRSTRDERQELIHQLEEEIHPILTKEQLEKIHQFHERFRERDPHRMRKGGEYHPRRRREYRDSLH